MAGALMLISISAVDTDNSGSHCSFFMVNYEKENETEKCDDKIFL